MLSIGQGLEKWIVLHKVKLLLSHNYYMYKHEIWVMIKKYWDWNFFKSENLNEDNWAKYIIKFNLNEDDEIKTIKFRWRQLSNVY